MITAAALSLALCTNVNGATVEIEMRPNWVTIEVTNGVLHHLAWSANHPISVFYGDGAYGHVTGLGHLLDGFFYPVVELVGDWKCRPLRKGEPTKPTDYYLGEKAVGAVVNARKKP